MAHQILVAEDNDDVRDFIVAALGGGEFKVAEARDGAAVLERLAYAPPALVLLDLHMPIMSGLEVLKRLRGAPGWAETPVVFLTASNQTDDLVEARRLGARGYLVKPVRPADLLAKVKRVIEDRDLIWLDDMTSVRAR
ncbi:response regulator [Brevundimonas sp.]|uniref:response regulator n=1 Tax=Brevundimonas sp. TaxID=1871086 RepID=UPI0037BE7575